VADRLREQASQPNHCRQSKHFTLLEQTACCVVDAITMRPFVLTFWH
jgi:hypothetical protein